MHKSMVITNVWTDIVASNHQGCSAGWAGQSAKVTLIHLLQILSLGGYQYSIFSPQQQAGSHEEETVYSVSDEILET